MRTSNSSVHEMIPAVAAEGLAEAVDAFCEGIGFSPEQTARVFEAAMAHGMQGEAACRSTVEPARSGTRGSVRCALGRSSRIHR